jgi:hypothetical protein
VTAHALGMSLIAYRYLARSRGGRHSLPIQRPIDGLQHLTQRSNRHGGVHRHVKEHAVMRDARRAPFAFMARCADFLLETLANPNAVTKLGRLLLEAEVRGEERRSLVKAHQCPPRATAVQSTDPATCQRLPKPKVAPGISRRDSHTGRPRRPSRSRWRSCGDHKVNGPEPKPAGSPGFFPMRDDGPDRRRDSGGSRQA